MAARLNPRHQEMVREKIRATQLINALQNHILGKKLMVEPSQVTAALGLLKKCLPDLQSTELSGGSEDSSPIRVIVEGIKPHGQ